MRDHGSLFAAPSGGPWLFGKRADLWLFGGTALVSLFLIVLGEALGLTGDAPPWIWLACILCVDVAHVWSTIFRVYLDGEEVRRRRGLYLGVPLVCYGLGVFAYAWGPQMFWRCLAYVAVYHFVRQQYGWVALYRRRGAETTAADRLLDQAAIYTATIYPLIHWHAHLPRGFHWFMKGDFVEGLATPVAAWLAPVYWAVMLGFCARQLWLWARGRPPNPGKVIVVLGTWACWHVGIISYDSDYAFTVTNVIIHGVPYLALTYRYGRLRGQARPGSLLARLAPAGVGGFVAIVVGLAFLEETAWDRLVWHEQPWLFGEASETAAASLVFLVPLLALPQAVHYALDGWVWRVRPANPVLHSELASSPLAQLPVVD